MPVYFRGRMREQPDRADWHRRQSDEQRDIGTNTGARARAAGQPGSRPDADADAHTCA